jgi:hypothetical protein
MLQSLSVVSSIHMLKFFSGDKIRNVATAKELNNVGCTVIHPAPFVEQLVNSS